MQMLQRIGCAYFMSNTDKGNACYKTLMGWFLSLMLLTWGSLRHKGACEGVSSPFSQDLQLVLCPVFSNLVALGPNRPLVSLHFLIPLWRAELKRWKPRGLWCQDVREKVNRTGHSCNTKRRSFYDGHRRVWNKVCCAACARGPGQTGAEALTNHLAQTKSAQAAST